MIGKLTNPVGYMPAGIFLLKCSKLYPFLIRIEISPLLFCTKIQKNTLFWENFLQKTLIICYTCGIIYWNDYAEMRKGGIMP